MRSVGLLPALASLGGACLGASGVAGPAPWAVWLPLLFLVIAIGGCAWKQPALATLSVACGFFAAAALLGDRARDDALHPSLRRVLDARFGGFAIETIGPAGEHPVQRLRVRLVEDAADRGDYVSLRADAVQLQGAAGAWQPVHGGALLSVSGRPRARAVEQWRAGRVIEMPVTFRRPTRYLDEGVPDFEVDLALAGTTLFGSVKSGLLIEVVRRGNPFAEWAADVRGHVRDACRRWIATGRGASGVVTGAVVTAVLIGDRSGLPDDIRDRLQAAGTYHVIAISGGNIAILAMLCIGLLALAGIQGRRAALLSIVLLGVYAGIVTSGPSVWRATIMAIVYLAARLIDQRTPVWQATAVAAGGLVVAYPLDVLDVGFVLTFGATAALIEGARWGSLQSVGGATVTAPAARAQALPDRPSGRVASWVRGSLTASLAVEVALLPVAALFFSRVTAAGLVLNLIAVPAMAVAQVAGLVVVLLDGFSSIAAPAGWLAHSGAWLLLDSGRLVEVAPWLARRVPPPAVAVVVAYYAGLALVLVARSRARLGGAVLLTASAVAIVVGAPSITSADPAAATTLRLTMLDVGQGDALLLEPPGAPAMLIDTGGAPFGSGGFDIGVRVLAPTLWARRIRGLGPLLLTHGDPDHIGGAGAVLADFSPLAVWWGISVPRHVPEQVLLAATRASGAGIESRRAGQQFAAGKALIRVLHPPEPDWERRRVRNDDSVVLEIIYGDVALLLTGDIGVDVEREILPHLTPARIRVLKVAHHGSRTSSSQELLEAWRPTVAFISCGRGNSFGHPAPDVLARLESVGAKIYRTDRDGEVTLETDGSRLAVSTFVGSRK